MCEHSTMQPTVYLKKFEKSVHLCISAIIFGLKAQKCAKQSHKPTADFLEARELQSLIHRNRGFEEHQGAHDTDPTPQLPPPLISSK